MDEIKTELLRNDGRITESEDIHASEEVKSVGHTSPYQVTRIVTSVRNHAGVYTIGRLINLFSNIRNFIIQIKALPELEERSIVKLDKQFADSILPDVQSIDETFRFGEDFFSNPKLEEIGRWSDRRREVRLAFQENVIPRNLDEKFRSLVGYGFERPVITLASLIPSVSYKEKIDAAKQEIKSIF